MNKVYPIGYNAGGAEACVEQLMSDPNTLLIDIRYSPRSWRSTWQEATLRNSFGERYRAAGRFLGNINYSSKINKPIKIADPRVGIHGLMSYLKEGHDLILLCQCSSYLDCHRKVVVDLLLKKMPEVEVVQPPTVATLPCISIMQPWAWIIMHGNLLQARGIPPKTIENRSWTTDYRGRLLLRAGSFDSEFFSRGKLDMSSFVYLMSRIIDHERAQTLYTLAPKTKAEYASGGIVGQCSLVGVLDREEAGPWKVRNQYGLQLADIEPLPFVKVAGDFRLFGVPASLVDETVERTCS